MISTLVPQHDGLLPYFLIYVCKEASSICYWRRGRIISLTIVETGVSAAIHTVVCYLSSPAVALKQFSGPARPPPIGLLARVYGVKNIYTSLIRLYAAYAIDNAALYDLAAATFMGVLVLYVTELVVFRTVRWQEATFPLVHAGVGLTWMLLQRGWYRALL